MKSNPSSSSSSSSSIIAAARAAAAGGGGGLLPSSSSFVTTTTTTASNKAIATPSSPCNNKVGLKRGPWTPEEDQLLSDYIKREGEGKWRTLPKKAGLLRCGKSCRLRWMNYLRPSVKRGHIAPDEEDLILRLHRLLGNRWSLIAGRIPGRTDNEIKNYWNTHLSKKLISQGIDPRTHKPLSILMEPNDHQDHHHQQQQSVSDNNMDDKSSPSKRIHYDDPDLNITGTALTPPPPPPSFMQEEDPHDVNELIFGSGDDDHHMMIDHDHDHDHDHVYGMMSIDHHDLIDGDHDVFSSFLNSLMSGEGDHQDVFNSQSQLLLDQLDHTAVLGDHHHEGDGGDLMFGFGLGWEAAPLLSTSTTTANDSSRRQMQNHEQQQQQQQDN